LAGVLLCGAALARTAHPQSTDPGAVQAAASQPMQQPQTASSAQPGGAVTQPSAPKIAPGSVIPVQLTKTVDAKKAKTGDEVIARVTMDMKTQAGEVMVPKDTKVYGHITEAQPRSKEQKESQLAIAFDHAVTKDGNTVPLPMSIQAIIGQQNNQSTSGGNDAGGPDPFPGPQTGGSTARSPMGSPTTPTAPSTPSPSAVSPTSDAPARDSSRPPITAQTQGVIGLSNITLAPNSNASHGSVVTSDKNNVKLESGTMLLLRVNQ